MSSESTEKKGKKEASPPHPVTVPVPSDSDLFVFLERIFAPAEELPERIKVCQVFGAGCRKIGPPLREFPYKPGDKKPTREDLVAMSNEIRALAQKDCEGIGTPMRYGILVFNFRRGESYYERKIIAMSPKGNTSKGIEAEDPVDDFEDFDDGPGSGKRAHGRLLDMSLQHMRYLFTQNTTAMANIIERQEQRLSRYEDVVDKLLGKYVDLVDAVEDAKSKAHERRLAEKWQDLQMKAVDEGIGLVKGLLPVAVNKIAGKEVIPTKETPESMAVKAFLDGMSKEQIDVAFGIYDKDTDTFTKAGLFTPAQTRLLAQIAKCEIAGEAIDQFIESLEPEQIAGAQSLFTMAQLAPLLTLAQSRKTRSAAGNGVKSTTS